MVVVNQLPGELPPWPKSRFQSVPTTAKNEPLEESELTSIPACYIRIEEDVFFLDHKKISKINFPPLVDIPEEVPPYIDLVIGRDIVSF